MSRPGSAARTVASSATSHENAGSAAAAQQSNAHGMIREFRPARNDSETRRIRPRLKPD
jgi:hypothetical protein